MAMNVFRFIGDMSHLASFFFLLQRIYSKRNVAGISLKTLELYLLVFVTRYLDLFFSYISLYNTTMKMLYIGMSASVVYLIRFAEPWKSSYKEEEDTFLHLKYGVAVGFGLGVFEGEVMAAVVAGAVAYTPTAGG